MHKENKRIIDKLISMYAEDQEAIELIDQAAKDIEYLESKETAAGYTGQTAAGKIQELEAYLHDWY